MKKKFTGMLICLLMVCMSLFAGCSLIEVDSNKYYNSIVAEVKNKEGEVVAKITSEELLNGYQTYGVYQEYYSGMTRAEAVQETIKYLQNRKITLIEAEKKYDVDREGKNLEDLEETYIWEQVASTLQSNLDYYLNAEEDDKTSSEESSKTDAATYSGYSAKAYLAKDGEGNFIIKQANPTKGVLDDFTPSVSHKDYNNKQDRELIYANFRENNRYGEKFTAYTKYLNNLKALEEGRGFSTNEKEVFEREIEKLYNQSYENYIISRYTYDLLNKGDVAAVEVQELLDLYSSKVRTSYTQYMIEQDSQYDTNMGSDPTTIYYYKEDGTATKFFSVANILFNKSATQTGKYELIVRSDSDGDGVYEQDSKEVVSKSSIYDFIEENIAGVIGAASTSKNPEIFGDALKECVFKYNQDPGMLSATANYYIGVDSEGKAVSSFVEEFNNAGLALYNNGQGVIGNIEITESDYGIHVLVYTGAYENLFAGIDHTFALNEEQTEGQLSAIEVLNTTRINPMLNKTLFDALYDELYVDNSSKIQQADLDVLRSGYSFTTYSGRIPDVLN